MVADACAIGDLNQRSQHGTAVLDWLEYRNGALIIGGKLSDELGRSPDLMKFLVGLSRAGRNVLLRLNDEAVRVRTKMLVAAKACKSNDQHVVAIIQMTGCSLVYSMDRKLHKDLQNRKLIGHAVSIYQSIDHGHLLVECRCLGRR
jgi:hypothetical protein